MDTTFDINKIDEERLSQPATYNQVRGLSLKFAKKNNGTMDWKLQKQVLGCLYGLIKANKLTFQQANNLFSKKALPKVFKDMINAYIESNPEA